MSYFLHKDMWDKIEFYKNYYNIYEVYPFREKYVEPVEEFIYSLPDGSSDLDIANTII